MDHALVEARAAFDRGEVPVGAVLVRDRVIVARSGNRTVELKDPTAHAEILVIRAGCALLRSLRLADCDLYVTLEPCTMCAAAISFARIRRLFFGVSDPKSGAVENGVCFYKLPTCHHAPDVYSGIGENQATQLLRRFFANRRHFGHQHGQGQMPQANKARLSASCRLATASTEFGGSTARSLNASGPGS